MFTISCGVGFPVALQSFVENCLITVFCCALFYVGFGLRKLTNNATNSLNKLQTKNNQSGAQIKLTMSQEILIVDSDTKASTTTATTAVPATRPPSTCRSNDKTCKIKDDILKQLKHGNTKLTIFLISLAWIIFSTSLLLFSQLIKLRVLMNDYNFYGTPYDTESKYISQIVVFIIFFVCFYSVTADCTGCINICYQLNCSNSNKSNKNNESNIAAQSPTVYKCILYKIGDLITINKHLKPQVNPCTRTRSPSPANDHDTINIESLDGLYESKTVINGMSIGSDENNAIGIAIAQPINMNSYMSTNANTGSANTNTNMTTSHGLSGLQLLKKPSVCLTDEKQQTTMQQQISQQPSRFSKPRNSVAFPSSNSDFDSKGSFTNIKAIVYDFENVLLDNSSNNNSNNNNNNNNDDNHSGRGINRNDNCDVDEKSAVRLFGGDERVEILRKHLNFVSNKKNCVLFLLCSGKQFNFATVYRLLVQLKLAEYFVGINAKHKIQKCKSTILLFQRIYAINSHVYFKDKSRELIIASIIKFLGINKDELLYIDSDSMNINNVSKNASCYHYFVSHKNKNKNIGLQASDIQFIQSKM